MAPKKPVTIPFQYKIQVQVYLKELPPTIRDPTDALMCANIQIWAGDLMRHIITLFILEIYEMLRQRQRSSTWKVYTFQYHNLNSGALSLLSSAINGKKESFRSNEGIFFLNKGKRQCFAALYYPTYECTAPTTGKTYPDSAHSISAKVCVQPALGVLGVVGRTFVRSKTDS